MKWLTYSLIALLTIILPIAVVEFGTIVLFLTVGLLVISGLSISFLRGNNFLVHIWLFFIGFPFFINVGGAGFISLGSSIFNRGAGQTVPLSLFILIWIVVLLLIKMAMRQKIIVNMTIKQFFTLIFLCGVVSLVGSLFNSNVGDVSYVIQFFVPFLSYIVIYNFVQSNEDYLSSMKTVLIGGLSGVLLLVLSNGIGSLISGSSFTDKILFFYVYQIYDYYPLTVGLIALLTLAYMPFAKSKMVKLALGVTFLICFISLTKLNARNAFVTFGFGIALYFMFSKINKALKFYIIVGCGLGIYVLYLMKLPVFVRFQTATSSNEVRFMRMKEGLETIYHNPIFGAMFRKDLVTGFHNQYLEIAGNGGLIIVTFFVVIIFRFLIRAVKNYRTEQDKRLKTLGLATICIVIAVMTVSNIAQSNFTQPFSAFLLWFIIGSHDAVLRLKDNLSTIK